ncbi:MAG: protein-tyrosine phosphatase, partial [Chitinophagales bacterium]
MEPLRIIDCHNHSLPFIDDGAVDLEMALAMLTVAEQSGTTDVVLTPHHLNGAFTNFATSTKKHINSLREQAEMAGINLRLHLGSEVHLVSETAEQLIKHKALTYGGHGKAALIELP